jgi:Bacterial toxin 44
LAGKELDYQAVANIHFGAIGRSAGMSQWLLEAGAGAFQIWDNRNHPNNLGPPGKFFDDPYDNWMIRFGSWLYDHYGSRFGQLKPEDLNEAMERFEKENGPPRKPLSP